MAAAASSSSGSGTTTSTVARVAVSAPLPEMELTVVQRMISATAGALITSMMVTPFDVIKTRMQSQAATTPISSVLKAKGFCPGCDVVMVSNGLMEHKVPKSQALRWCGSHQFSSTADAFIKIVRYEGAASLYNGLAPTLTMAIPATVLYFATFDKLNIKFKDNDLGMVVSPLLAGSLARLIAATSIAPLELLRTRAQAEANPLGMMALGRSEVRENGFRGLFRGLVPTLIRDIPFSAIYWVCVENAKIALSACDDQDEPRSRMVKALVAGASSAMVASVVTTPFDVIKTKIQTCPKAEVCSTYRIARDILRVDGFGGFFVGLTPRIAKVVPACAIMLSTYEGGKRFFAQQ